VGKDYTQKFILASKGVFYGDAMPGGVLNMEAWGTPEERILQSPSLTMGETINRLIKRLTDCPIDPEELILQDRAHFFQGLRCLSIGSSYSFNYKCTESSCDKKNRHHMDLEKDLHVTYADDEDLLVSLGVSRLEEPFLTDLPGKEVTVGWNLLRGKDERAIDEFVSRERSRTASRRRGPANDRRDDEDISYEYRVARRIISIDGDEISLPDALAFVKSLKGDDSLALRRAVLDIELGIDPVVYPVCVHCGWENEIILPTDKSFFLPER
jgi:hypothetical protein